MHMPMPGVNVPVVASAPALLNCDACWPVSDEPRPSMIAMVGSSSRNLFFTGALSAAPPLDEQQHRAEVVVAALELVDAAGGRRRRPR